MAENSTALVCGWGTVIKEPHHDASLRAGSKNKPNTWSDLSFSQRGSQASKVVIIIIIIKFTVTVAT